MYPQTELMRFIYNQQGFRLLVTFSTQEDNLDQTEKELFVLKGSVWRFQTTESSFDGAFPLVGTLQTQHASA